MPPRRKGKALAESATSTSTGTTKATSRATSRAISKVTAKATAKATSKAPRPSKLAKLNKITAQEENEIREAFSLFSEPLAGEKEGVLPTDDLRSAMIALGIPPRDHAELDEYVATLDPDNEGFTTFEPFLTICALKLHGRDDDDDAHRQELDEAFGLFTNAGAAGGAAGPQPGNATHITMTHLKRIATMLNEDVPDDLLRDMILEANGGIGVARGVDKGQFDQVMMAAGVWKGRA